MGRAYGVPVGGAGTEATEGVLSPVARGRPNWWVILAVSLALMALLVATAGSTPRASRHGRTLASAPTGNSGRRTGAGDAGASSRTSGPAATTTTTAGPATTTTTTTTTVTPPTATPVGAGAGTSLLSTRTLGSTASTPPAVGPVVTTTTVPPTTTTSLSASVPAARTQTQGYLDPPLQTSNSFGFTGSGAMEISVLWSGTTYLTLEVSCPGASQSVGGTSAMAASLPDARGNCRATVTEPSSESVSLTYTITIGPAGG